MRSVQAIVRFTTVLMLILSLGLHWAVLQTVAWTGMMFCYSRQASFTQAVSKTFDGKHPCCLCTAIQKSRAEEKNQERVEPVVKLDLGPIWQGPEFDFRCAREPVPSTDAAAPARTDEPPKPRPRGAPPNTPA
jgi:hypothetical protein